MRIESMMLAVLLCCSVVFSLSLSDEGTNARVISTGQPIFNGTLKISIYNDSFGDGLVWEESFPNAIQNGSWNLILHNIPLKFNTEYWKDYAINGVDLDFSGAERLEFNSPLGEVGIEDLTAGINLSTATGKAGIGACGGGEAVQNTTNNGVQCISLSGASSMPTESVTAGTFGETFGGGNYTFPDNVTILGTLFGGSPLIIADDVLVIGNINVTANVTALNFFGYLNASYILNSIWLTDNVSVLTNFFNKTESDDRYLQMSDQRYNETALANTKALPGTCSGSQVVQNTTTSGVQCMTPSATETDPIWTANSSTVARTGTATCTGTAVAQNLTTTTSGTTSQCITPPQGTVTSIAAGTGMSFTTITTTGTVNVNTTLVGAVANNTNIGGIISNNLLTFGWIGTLADSKIASASTWNAKAGTGTANCASGYVAQNVTTTTSGITSQCVPTSAGGGYATIQDEGSPLTQRTTLNFAGSGVACADDTTRTTCTINGGGGSGYRTLITLTSDIINNNATACTYRPIKNGDTGLNFSVVAGTTYRFHALIMFTSAATTTGSKWSVSGPASPTLLAYRSVYSLAAGTQTQNTGNAYSLPTACSATSAFTTGNIAEVFGIIKPSANGMVQIIFGSEIASSAITAKAGSTLEVW